MTPTQLRLVVLGVIIFFAAFLLTLLNEGDPVPSPSPTPQSSFDAHVSRCDQQAEKLGWTDREYYACVNLKEWRGR